MPALAFAPRPARFHLQLVAPVYGPRSEITGSQAALVETAHTRGWAEHLAAQLDAHYAGSEAQVAVIDRYPERGPTTPEEVERALLAAAIADADAAAAACGCRGFDPACGVCLPF